MTIGVLSSIGVGTVRPYLAQARAYNSEEKLLALSFQKEPSLVYWMDNSSYAAIGAVWMIQMRPSADECAQL